MLRGHALAGNGAALGGVRVEVTDHPEFGYTLTSLDGTYNLVVNGGTSLTANLDLTGYMSAQRTQDVPWQMYVDVDDVVLKQFDSKVTTIDHESTAPIQVASSTPVTDSDGTRQTTLMFKQGTDATMRLPNGSTQPLDDLAVRSTEFTVGPNGVDAMPGELPATSAYTYATELSVDQAVQAGATDVTFSKPVATYVDDFLGFPAGTLVPAAYYDEAKQAWIPSANGVVLKIVGVTGGIADVDVTGDGLPDTGAALDKWGITTDELRSLATQYPVGHSLWRVAVKHFTPWDFNWPYGCKVGDCPPPKEPPPPPPYCPDCNGAGSIVGLLNQTLGESQRIVGTPFELAYSSDRAPGYKEAHTVRVPLTGAAVAGNLQQVDLQINVAGREFTQSFAAAPNLQYTFTWDGKDAFGRDLQGAQVAHVSIGYTYPAVYLEPDEFAASFAQFGGRPISGDQARKQITVWQTWNRTVGVINAGSDGLGGWTLSVHHTYDPGARALYLGDGTRRTADAVRSQLETVAGDGFPYGESSNTALATSIGYVRGVAAAADGGFYIADSDNNVIRRVTPEGGITTVAGGGSPADGVGDGLPAKQAQLVSPSDVAVSDDGTLYISDTGNARIRRVAPNGVISTIAGGGDPASLGDGGPATAAFLSRPRGIALAKDGTLYVADTGHDRVRRITPDGGISTAAGGGVPADGLGDGGPGPAAALDHPYDVAVDAQGVLYVADGLHHRIRAVKSDGVISTLAGNGQPGSSGDGGPAKSAQIGEPQGLTAGADGTVYFADRLHHVVRKVTTDGFIARVAGTGSSGYGGDSGPPLQARLSFPQDVSVAKDGSLLIADAANFRIRRSRVGLPGFTDADITIPSEDGSELYLFNENGRHLRTVDAVTGNVRYQFGYDSGGRLTSVTDEYGNVTQIERNAAGVATAIVAPGGQRTALTTTGGRLTAIADPAGDTTHMTYSSDGLLTSYTDPRGGVSTFVYDAFGRLASDKDALNATATFVRTETARGYRVTRTSPLGRATTYEVEHLPNGDVRTTATSATGGTSLSVLGEDGTSTVTTPEGMKVVAVGGPDPRFGMLAPILTKLVRSTPSGLTQTITHSREAVLDNPGDPLSVQKLTDRLIDNGHTWQSDYDAPTRTLTSATPSGHQDTETFDAHGNLVRADLATGLDPVLYTYDARGRLTSVKQGSQQFTYAYDSANRLVSRTDAAGKTTSFAWDAADRVTTLALPSGNAYHYTYDPNGNRIGITLPSGSVHSLAYDALNRVTGYTPPGSAPYTRGFDADRMGTHFALPSGRTTDVAYDAGGRPTSQSDHTGATLDGHTTLAYASGDLTSRVSVATREVPGAFTSATSLTYDGSLVTGKAVDTGADADYNGATTYVYDDEFLLKERKLSSGADTVTVPITRNVDQLMTQDGRFAIARDGPGGSASSYSDSAANMALTYDADARESTRTLTVGGTQVYRVAMAYDNADHISQRVETVGGTPQTYAYTYTADGFLAAVSKGGSPLEQYAYDANGNRTSRLVSGSTETSAYDAQDRLTKRGATNYLFDADGYLQARGGDTFDYSAAGELVSAHAGGQTIDYAYDAFGRRVGRTAGGAREAYFYGDPRRPFLITAARDSARRLTTFYYDDDGFLYALDRAGAHYYVGTDQVGTPHVVTDASGTIVKTLAYDSFGSVVSDSNPSFELPIGFAGGLVDPSTRLVRFGMRDYDPDAGRWTARDPVFFDAPAVNLYAYTDNNPLSFSDPSGLDWSWEGFKSSASEYGGRAVDWAKANSGKIADFAAEQLGKVSDKVKLGKETWDKGKKVVDTANEVEETILTVEENMQEPANGNESGNQAAKLLQCGLKWLSKAPLPFDFITKNASETIDQVVKVGNQNYEAGTGIGNNSETLRTMRANGDWP